jgi:hypothetical protein
MVKGTSTLDGGRPAADSAGPCEYAGMALIASALPLTRVSCALLKKNVPEAARFITWDTPAAPGN